MRMLSKKPAVPLLLLFAGAFQVPALEAQGTAPNSGAAANPQAIQEMQKVEDGWSQAINKRDQFGLELALSPQFIGISSTGEVTTRDQQIVKLFAKGDLPLSFEQKVISARFLNDVAIVNGTYVKRWKVSSGTVDEKGIYTHVFEHTRGRWLCINSQQTVVAEKTPEKAEREKSKPKSSSAELPLHIPLVYKGPASAQPAPAAGSSQPPS